MSRPIKFQPSNDNTHGLLLGWRQLPSERAAREPIWDTAEEGHLLTIAPTGAGKGVSCIIPALLSWRGPAIVIDPRGENYAVTAARRRAMGQTVHVLDPFDVTGEINRDSLNPLDLLDYRSDVFEDNAAVIAELLIQGLTFKQDPFWDERATHLIISLITSLFEADASTTPTLREIQQYLTMPAMRDDLPHSMESMKKRAKIFATAFSPNEFGMERTRAAIFATASSHLGFIRSLAVDRALSNSTILLDDITSGAAQTIYIVVPPDKLRSHGKLLRLWLGTMLAAVSRRKRRPPLPTLFLIDEAAQLGPLNELRASLTLMRGFGVRCWTFWQDLSQLKQIYPDDWESLVNNSPTQQFFGTSTPHADAQLTTYLGHGRPAGDRKGKKMILCKGGELTTVTRADYRHDRVFSGLASPNPFYPAQTSGTVTPFESTQR